MSSRIQRVHVAGHDIRVSTRLGTGDGAGAGVLTPPLVLCNGIGASFDLLEPFVAELPPELTVVSFDVPGVGDSAMPRVPYNFAMLAVLLGRLLDQLGHDTVDVLGISWGGGLAQQFALQNPGRCRRLVLVSTATGMLMVPAHPSVLLRMATPRRYREPKYAVSIAPDIYGGRMRAEPELAREVLAPERLSSTCGYLFQLLAGLGWTSLPFLPLLRQRTLVLSGRDDPIIPLVNARLMAALIPHAELHVFDDGHLGLVTSAKQLAPVITRFLST